MRICHIIIGLNVGGAELMLKRLLERNNESNSVLVISLMDCGNLEPEFRKLNISLISLGLQSVVHIPKVFFSLRNQLKLFKPDIVQTWMYHSDFLGGLAARSLGIRNIAWNVRNTDIKTTDFLNFGFRLLCSMLSHVIPKKIVYVSQSSLDAHSSCGFNRFKGTVIRNGFDLKVWEMSPQARTKLRNEWGVSEDSFLIASVGRYALAKDHKTFISAIKLASTTDKSIKGLLVGRGLTNNKVVQQQIADAREHFVILDNREDIPAVLSASDAFCLHSITEGFPNVLGEAMSMKLPCVTTRAGDAEYILNSKDLTCDIRDDKCLADKLLFLKNLPINERFHLGRKNRERISNLFSLDKCVKEYEKMYKSMFD